MTDHAPPSAELVACVRCGCDQIHIERRLNDSLWTFRCYCRACDIASPRGVAERQADADKIARGKWNEMQMTTVVPSTRAQPADDEAMCREVRDKLEAIIENYKFVNDPTTRNLVNELRDLVSR